MPEGALTLYAMCAETFIRETFAEMTAEQRSWRPDSPAKAEPDTAVRSSPHTLTQQ